MSLSRWCGFLRLFCGIVGRPWHDGRCIGVRTAWQVARIVYPAHQRNRYGRIE